VKSQVWSATVGPNVKHDDWKTLNSRALAAEVLRRLASERAARASELLAAALGRLPDARDRGLVTELVYGVLRWQRRLDASLAPWLPRGIEGVEPMAQWLLRVGVYQLHWLGRVPHEIAVSATQDAARAAGLGRLTGLLNAVLRKVAASPEVLPEGDGDEAIGVRASLPDWVVGALREALPERVEAEASALRARAAVTLRPTLGKGGAKRVLEALAREGLSGRLESHGLVELESGDAFRTAAAADGLFVAQDPAGTVVVDAIAAALGGELAGRRVLDLCAGRGVKATALADRGARVVAVDVSSRKLDELVRVARRLGVQDHIERTLALDATAEGAAEALRALGEFDAVLVDAPCTGLGTLRRHPEIAWRRQPTDVQTLAALQHQLVAAGAARVAVGGGLIYAVCSFIRAEGRVSLPLPFEEVAWLDLAPSSGLDAFQVRRFVRRSA